MTRNKTSAFSYVKTRALSRFCNCVRMPISQRQLYQIITDPRDFLLWHDDEIS